MHTGAIRKLDVSADGTLIATASDDKTARLWSVPERRLLKTFRLSIPELKAAARTRAMTMARHRDSSLQG